MNSIEQRFFVRGSHPLKHLLKKHSGADWRALKCPSLVLILRYINTVHTHAISIFNINLVLSSHLRLRFLASFFLIFNSFLISLMRATYLPSPSFVHPNDSGEQYNS